MRGTSLAISALLLLGCASAPERPNPWLEPLPPTEPPTRPLQLPPLPSAEVQGDSLTLGGDPVSSATFQALVEYRTAAEANTTIAAANADQAEELIRASTALFLAGRAEHQIAELRLALLEEERRARLYADVRTYSLLGIVLIAFGIGSQ